MNFQQDKRIILASQSQQRKLLMEALGIKFDIIPANIDEQQITEQNLVKRAILIAEKKAKTVAVVHPHSVVIAADTYGRLDGQKLEKPESKQEAVKMLKRQSNQWVEAITGFSYVDSFKNIFHTEHKITKVKFRPLTLFEIKKYVQNNPVTTWSAGFAPTYPAGAALIEQTQGSYTGFTYGLPMESLMPQLKRSFKELFSQLEDR